MLQKLQAVDQRPPSQANRWSPSQVVRGNWINCIAANISAKDLERTQQHNDSRAAQNCKICGRAQALGRPRNVSKQAM